MSIALPRAENKFNYWRNRWKRTADMGLSNLRTLLLLIQDCIVGHSNIFNSRVSKFYRCVFCVCLEAICDNKLHPIWYTV
jgi:hypothetical protein